MTPSGHSDTPREPLSGETRSRRRFYDPLGDDKARAEPDQRQVALDLLDAAWKLTMQSQGSDTVIPVQLAIAQVNATLYVGDCLDDLRSLLHGELGFLNTPRLQQLAENALQSIAAAGDRYTDRRTNDRTQLDPSAARGTSEADAVGRRNGAPALRLDDSARHRRSDGERAT